MDTENVKIWASKPDVCRFCLSANGTIDLEASYVNEDGQNEVYCETLQNCFGINMLLVSEWSPSICAVCAEHLKHANKFRLQVLEAEQNFTQYFNIRGNGNVKIEPDLENDHCSDEYLMTYSETTKVAKKQKSHTKKKKVKEKKSQNTIDWDSDTPLKELTRVKEIEDGLNCELLMKEREGESMEFLTADRTSKGSNRKPETKLISERKRIRLTCEIILTNTTACPFRHHKSWFQCFYCTLDFMEINELRTHLFDIHKNVPEELKTMKRYPRSLQIDISNLICNLCNESLINVDCLFTHFKDIHNRIIYKECIADYKVNSSPYICHLCSKEFHVFRTLTTHLNEHYANCICDVCGKSFLNTKRLKVHKRTHESGHFPCSECGKVLKTKISKANHIETAHFKRVIKCQLCFKPMKHYNDRIKHMSEEHNITYKFKCNICAREFNIKHYLATHMRQTHGHKNKKCLECGMAFITNHGLKKHMQKHSGVKEFTCNICCKSYARSYSLKEHMRVHGNDRF